MRIVEALEGKGCRMPLMKGEVELAEKLATITRQVGGPCFVLQFVSCIYYGFVKKVHTDKQDTCTVERIWSRTF